MKLNMSKARVAALMLALVVSLAALTAGVATARVARSPVVVVKLAHNARLGKFLVNGRGFTLYRLTAEKNGHIVCTGRCASFWPPFVIRPGGHVVRRGAWKGKLTLVKRPNGPKQVVYNGMPLYMFLPDKKPGQTKGQGLKANGGVWYVVHPGQKSGSGYTPSPGY